MKKVFLSLAIVVIAFSANAQSDKSLKFGVGITAGLPLADIKVASSFAVKGDVQAEYAATEAVGLTLSAGYIKYIAKSDYSTGSVIPVLVGAKFAFSENLYGHAQLGVSFVSDGGGSAFTYAPSIGYKVSDNFDVALKYESLSKGGGTFSYIGLRAGLSF
jgi:hypothetical protein